jgi:hypothetical protein
LIAQSPGVAGKMMRDLGPYDSTWKNHETEIIHAAQHLLSPP